MVDFDFRDQYPPGTPGTHALIVGISRYQHLPPAEFGNFDDPTLGLEQLSSAATSAYRVFEWLSGARAVLRQPLLTCRLLVSPSDAEAAEIPELGNHASACTRDEFLAAAKSWRGDAAFSRADATFFYFAGHGLRRIRAEHVMILGDFGNGFGPALDRTVGTQSLLAGMAPSVEFPDVARTQLFFLDSCQMPLKQAYSYEEIDAPAVWDAVALDEAYPDDRDCPTFYGSRPGTTAWAVQGTQTLFSEALLKALDGGGAVDIQGRWCITINSLHIGLSHFLTQLARENNTEQTAVVDRGGQQTTLLELETAPEIALQVTLKPVPDPAVYLVVDDLVSGPREMGPPLHPHPFPALVRAGLYNVEARMGDTSIRKTICNAQPPSAEWVLG